MGSSCSRNECTQTCDDRLACTRLFVNFVFLGIVIGFFLHNGDLQFWATFHHRHSFFWGIKWLFYIWYACVWVITYCGFFALFLRPFIRAVARSLVGVNHALPSQFFLELLYGLYAYSQIIGGWLDGESSECFRKNDCQYSSIMLMLWNFLESICEYFFGYEYDYRDDVYFRARTNVCTDIFLFAPRFIITLLGSITAAVFLAILKNP